MINEIINVLNKCFAGICSNQIVHGLAQRVYRTYDNGVEYMPGLVDKDGEIKIIDIDDVNDLLIYHKTNGMSLAYSQKQGYGDSRTNEDGISCSVITIWDIRKLNVQPVDMALLIRTRFAQEIADEQKNVKQILILPSAVILNNKQVFDSEYTLSEPYLLPNYINIIQINYSIQLKYDNKCMQHCISC